MSLAPGSRLGDYEILAPLGAGGMGEVYRARDPKLDREVAIKVLPTSVADDPEALARFEREAKAVAALSHPNILAIHDFGIHGGTAYAVMELLEGETLREKIDAGTILARQAVDYAMQIAKGLAAAHEKGVVHRDLKPENLFVSRDGHLKILDFGLAKRVPTPSADDAESGATASFQTQPGTLIGTVGYMSPEQVRGLPADHRSDIFSVGAILYEMLSGKRAFGRRTSSDTIAAILRDEPPEFSDSGRNVSFALDQIVRHCLEKDRSNRFQSARDVVFALSEASSGAVTPASGAPAAAVPAGNRRLLLAAAIAVPVLLAVGVALLRQAHRGGGEAGGPRRLAVLPFENVGSPEDDYFADGIADEVRGKLTSLPGIQVIARGSSTPYKKTTKTPRQIAQELNVSYLLSATVRWHKSGGTSRVQVRPELVDLTRRDAPTSKWQQPFDADLTDVFQVQSDIATRVAEALGVALGATEERRLAQKPTQDLAAYDLFLKGEEASNSLAIIDPPTLRKALGLYEQAVARDPGFLLAWSRVSEAASMRYANAVPTPEMARRAREAAERAVALGPERPEGYWALGTYWRLVEVDHLRALEEFEKGLRIAPASPDLLRGSAMVQQGIGQWEPALERFRETQRLDPRSVNGWVAIGNILLRLRRYPEAREAQERGLALAPTNLRLIQHRAMTYLGEGDLAGARAILRKTPSEVEPTALVAYLANYNDLVWVLDESQRELLLRLPPSVFDDDRATWALALAQAYALRGDAANVRRYAEEARKAFEEQLRSVPDDSGRRVSLGLSLAYLGRKDEATREGERGAALTPVSKDSRSGPYYEHQLARIAILAGEPEKALDRLEPLLKIPYYLSPGWLRIDPNFDPLRQNPRFQRLAAGP
jgi:serine/threonine-protein kinase